MKNKYLFFYCIALIFYTSCNNSEKIIDNKDHRLKEGSFELTVNDEKIVFSKIFEDPYNPYSNSVPLGISYTAYEDLAEVSKQRSIKIILLKDHSDLSFVQYRYSNTFANWDENENTTLMDYKMEKQDNVLKGSFSGNLYHTGKEDATPIVIQQCSFLIHLDE